VSIRTGLVIAVASVGILAAGWSAPAAAQSAACTGNGKISKQIAKQMVAAQDAMKAKKWQESLSKMREAEAVPGGKSAFDAFTMSQFRAYIYTSTRQEGEAARELENTLNSPCMPEARKADTLKNLVGLYTALRNYPKAIDYGNRALKLSRDPEIQIYVAQAYYQSGNNKEAVNLMNQALEQGGGRPKEQQLLLILSACTKTNDNACQRKVLEKLVVNYPKTEYWQNLTDALRKGDNNDLQTLNVMRLASHIKVMKKPDEYKEFAQLSLDEKLSCEAQAVLEDGFAKKVFVDKRDVDVNTRLLNTAKTRCVAEKAAVAPAENAANQATTGDAFVKAGAQYLVGGNPGKGAELIQKGITKNSLGKGDQYEAQRTDEAYILLGIAQLKNNNKPEAEKAFRAVKRDPTMASIARFWLLSL
jgi:tetratricopeptide (TPR) repeat protein